MAQGLWEKIEAIRAQPEHIRMRYVVGCLFVSMLFIVGIWLLTVGESFHSISKEVPAAALKGKELLPKNQVPSFSSLLERTTPLQVDNQGMQENGDYFDKQFQKGAQNTTENAQTAPQAL
ncbi:MAG: hypothetical protein WAV46_01645 [Candidatus Moraniibacteriota bacterium]